MPPSEFGSPRIWIDDRSSEAVADDLPALLHMLLHDPDPERVCLLQQALRRGRAGREIN